TGRHFRAEYGPAASTGVPEPELRVMFRRPAKRGAGFDGAHKTVRWHVEIEEPLDGPLRVEIQLTGAPRSFGLSLLPGYVIAPLRALGALRSWTRNLVAPPLRLGLETLGSSPVRSPLRLGTIVVAERGEVSRLEREPLDPSAIVATASGIIREQRRSLELLSRGD